MSEFVEILEGQITEARSARSSTPSLDSARKVIRKRQLVPLERPPMADMATADLEDLPMPSEPVEEEPQGGKLWEPDPDVRRSVQHIPTADPQRDYCLMDLIMEPPRKKLEPTLFTYYDFLVARGEV
jgi:hypothetical protein